MFMKDVKVFLKKKKKKNASILSWMIQKPIVDEKQKLAEYQNKYYKLRKKAFLQL